MESPASEVDVPAPPQLPTWTLLPPCSPHSDPYPPPVPSCLWDSCLPLISSGSAYTRVEHSILSPVDLLPLWSSLPLYPTFIGQWTHPFCGTIPHPRPQVHGFSGLIRLWGGGLMLWLEADAWNTPPRRLLGTLLSTFTLPPMEPPVSGGWTLLTQRSHPCPCPGLSTLLDASLVFTFPLPCPCGAVPWP